MRLNSLFKMCSWKRTNRARLCFVFSLAHCVYAASAKRFVWKTLNTENCKSASNSLGTHTVCGGCSVCCVFRFSVFSAVIENGNNNNNYEKGNAGKPIENARRRRRFWSTQRRDLSMRRTLALTLLLVLFYIYICMSVRLSFWLGCRFWLWLFSSIMPTNFPNDAS